MSGPSEEPCVTYFRFAGTLVPTLLCLGMVSPGVSPWSSQGSEALWDLRSLEGEKEEVLDPFLFLKDPTPLNYVLQALTHF